MGSMKNIRCADKPSHGNISARMAATSKRAPPALFLPENPILAPINPKIAKMMVKKKTIMPEINIEITPAINNIMLPINPNTGPDLDAMVFSLKLLIRLLKFSIQLLIR